MDILVYAVWSGGAQLNLFLCDDNIYVLINVFPLIVVTLWLYAGNLVIVLPFEALWGVCPMMMLRSLNHLQFNIFTTAKERSYTELTLVSWVGVQHLSLCYFTQTRAEWAGRAHKFGGNLTRVQIIFQNALNWTLHNKNNLFLVQRYILPIYIYFFIYLKENQWPYICCGWSLVHR